MEAQDLIARLLASRQRTVEAAGATFTVTLPTDHAWRTTIEAHRNSEGVLQEARAFRAILDAAISGWSGVTTRHLLADAETAEPVPFTPALRSVLLDHRQDIADEIVVGLAAQMRARRVQREDAAKN